MQIPKKSLNVALHVVEVEGVVAVEVVEEAVLRVVPEVLLLVCKNSFPPRWELLWWKVMRTWVSKRVSRSHFCGKK
jgi:hypothetical protein